MLDALRRHEIRNAITALARLKIEAGMSEEDAIAEAGREYREAQRKEHERKLDEVTAWLQGRNSK
jgi:hypothetical protein